MALVPLGKWDRTPVRRRFTESTESTGLGRKFKVYLL